MQYQVLNNWRTSQSAANLSLVLNSLLAGNLQGILRKSGRLARIFPSERSKISLLEDNSLETGTGNFIAQNREFMDEQGICCVLQGIVRRVREIPRAGHYR